MRHSKKRRQLGRFTSWHDATIKSLARNMVICQSIKTTMTRAKASRPMVEKLIALGKANSLFARRQAQKILGEHRLVNLLFNDIAPRFANRSSGFTRIISLGNRRGDDAKMVIFELTELKKKEPKKIKPAKESKLQETPRPQETPQAQEPLAPEQAKEFGPAVKERTHEEKKPQKKFMGGLRTIFKKNRDSL